MKKFLAALSFFVIVGAVFLAACSQEEQENFGYIFREDGIEEAININPDDWNTQSQVSTSNSEKKNISFFLDAGTTMEEYALNNSKYYSIISSIPEIIKTEFTNKQNEKNFYKVVDYPYLLSDSLFSSDEEGLPALINNEDFYGTHIKVKPDDWNAHKPEWYEEDEPNHYYGKYDTDYLGLASFISNDYSKNKSADNLYIISSGFSCENSSNVLQEFSSSIYSNILYNNHEIMVGLAGFITETSRVLDKDEAYFIMAIGAKEDVYTFLNHIDEAYSNGFSDDNDFFVIYINEQIEKNDAAKSMYDPSLQGNINDFITLEKYIGQEISDDSYLNDLDTYSINGITDGFIEINLPYEMHDTCALDIMWTLTPRLEIVKGQYVFTGSTGEIIDADGNNRDHIAQAEYDFVYSKLGHASPEKKTMLIKSNINDYINSYNQVLDDETANQILTVSKVVGNQNTFYVPMHIDTESTESNMPYVITVEIEIQSQTNKKILDYKEYGETSGCEVFSQQNTTNIDVINSWENSIYSGLCDGINCLIGDIDINEYTFTKTISFILYKNKE